MLPKEIPDYLKVFDMPALTKKHLGKAVDWDGTERVALLYVVALAAQLEDKTISTMKYHFLETGLSMLLHDVRMRVGETFAEIK